MWNYLKNAKYSNVAPNQTLRFEWSDFSNYGDSFETVTAWTGLVTSTTYVKNGTYSALWYNCINIHRNRC
jgi:hypothetical protein